MARTLWSDRPLGVKLATLVGAGAVSLGVFAVITVQATAIDLSGNTSAPAVLTLSVGAPIDVVLPASDIVAAGESHDLVVSLNHGQPALAALCTVLEKWVRHFLGTGVRIGIEREIDDDHWVWHVGLDAQASGVLNDLYQGHEVTPDRMERMLCLFRLTFDEPSVMRPAIAGRPVYLAMAMDTERRLKLKPQNLLLNLPLARLS